MRNFFLFCIGLFVLPAQAEGLTPSLAQWQRTAQNPLSPNFSLPIEYKFHGGAPDGDVHIGSFGAIMPIRFDGWNIINELTLNIMGTPGDITGIRGLPQPYTGDGHGGSDGYAAGLADTYFTSYFSPRINDEFSLGLGATFVFPTDEPSRELGSGKFSIGPAVMLVYQTPKYWTLGLQAQQIWSVIGSAERDHVSQMIVKPTINYNLPDGWYLQSNMEVIANWESPSDQRWTVPVGVGIGKIFAVGKNAIDTRIEGHYNAVTPDLGPTWSINASFTFIFDELD
ncbi:conserved hypothetical protein [Bathymodiolus platifrons methanotrophic gill symbiont]|uniref:hypothetical protein n=1 Tax=Bathymodiolus platifrons methanotrophic gill symbiont TaxID=113268 RepID=UPI000B41535B|nr:hypothetical protein [Bathymodiolus platifrons methanotrophic gill symbiont]TXK97663.1 hypothetical protein BMR10_04380 [Methylococcaceae bacterium CS4]TXK99978.1 hypothetical protein BMR11_05015 [Methylococcaceae bacterium CS5]TXL06873.1 hypothetical protein BMR07_05900 [Methylococcaceae bacterium CS1]TXL07837.1 hypothetical protein BMR09_04730 [Methylococcaceae bacterium CS3]TXL10924.1 hypothetical protein BMR08_06530 [Methylococcaceae bacterium CS2]